MKTNYEIMKKIHRDQRLEHEAKVGRPRAKSWTGKKNAEQDRRDWKRSVRNSD